jgi:hypothetical protein
MNLRLKKSQQDLRTIQGRRALPTAFRAHATPFTSPPIASAKCTWADGAYLYQNQPVAEEDELAFEKIAAGFENDTR